MPLPLNFYVQCHMVKIMKTIEALYIMPIVFVITALAITISFRLHDRVVSYAVSYGILTDQVCSLENKEYKPKSGYTKGEITDIISNLFLLSDKSSFSVCLSGDCLYIQNNHSKDDIPAFFSHFERCDTIRKESMFIINLLKNNK